MAAKPAGTGTPNFASSSLAWYSWMFMGARAFRGSGNAPPLSTACAVNPPPQRLESRAARLVRGLSDPDRAERGRACRHPDDLRIVERADAVQELVDRLRMLGLAETRQAP